MPSLLHEGLAQLLRDCPELMATLLTELLGVPLPRFTQARMDEAALHQLVPTEHFADGVILFIDGDPARPVFGVILEVQLQPDPRKLFTWPLYAVAARARHECPFVVVVATPDPKVARWAAQTIHLGPDLPYRVLVLGPEAVPTITDPTRAAREPYLAMLSVIAHGQGDQATAVAIAQATAAGIRALPKDDQRLLYWFIIVKSLGHAARKAFEMLPNIRPFLDESQLRAFDEAEARGEARGEAHGKAEAILRILTKRGIAMTEAHRERVLGCTDLATLDGWLDRVLTLTAIDELFA